MANSVRGGDVWLSEQVCASQLDITPELSSSGLPIPSPLVGVTRTPGVAVEMGSLTALEAAGVRCPAGRPEVLSCVTNAPAVLHVMPDPKGSCL